MKLRSPSDASRTAGSGRTGRPPLAPAERRDRSLSVALTTSEWATLREAAARAGQRPAAYLREAALRGGWHEMGRVAALKPIDTQLRRAGNNVNQIAHAANTALRTQDQPALCAALGGADKAIEELRAALRALMAELRLR
ncbi:MAG: MobC family plasmid mobilization relaxosome protein [Steroidobacteraceae bacterium]